MSVAMRWIESEAYLWALNAQSRTLAVQYELGSRHSEGGRRSVDRHVKASPSSNPDAPMLYHDWWKEAVKSQLN